MTLGAFYPYLMVWMLALYVFDPKATKIIC